MKNVPCLLGIWFLFVFAYSSYGQWSRVTYPFTQMPVVTEIQSGAGVSFFDVNEDGWDDLTFCTYGGPTRCYLNNQGYFSLAYSFPNTGFAKSCAWGDLDEDGDNDLVVARFDSPLQVFINLGNGNFQENTNMISGELLEGNQFTGVTLGDYNRDSFLDIAVTNFSNTNPNRIYTNINGQYFVPLESVDINTNTKTSFQPAWVDINQDYYADLVVANDHALGNECYLQNPEGNFEDVSVSSQLYSPIYAMSVSFCDFDNDFDEDLFMSNVALSPCLLMKNMGNNAFEQDNTQDITFNLESWGALWIDADNDEWNDLFLCTRGGGAANQDLNNVYLHQENGYLVNTPIPSVTDLDGGYYCNAKGDFNNDGRADFVITPENSGAINLYKNTTINSNHYFKFKLNGRLSNRNGIGSRYRCFFQGHQRSGYVQAGENYLSQNSQNILLGLGQATAVDSMLIYWPSGATDRYYNLTGDTLHNLIEGETVPGISLAQNPCGLESTQVSVTHWPIHFWNNGDSAAVTTYNQNPIEVEVGTGFGHTLFLQAEMVQSTPVQHEFHPPTCSDDWDGFIHYWTADLNGNTVSEFMLDSLGEGAFPVFFNYNSGCLFADTVELVALSHPFISSIQLHHTCPDMNNGSVMLIMQGGTLPYNQVFNDTLTMDQLQPGIHQGIVTDYYNCSATWEAEILQHSFITTLTQPTCVDSPNGSLLINYSNGTEKLESFAVDSLSPGFASFLYTTNDGCELNWSDSIASQELLNISCTVPPVICSGDSAQFNPAVSGVISGGTWNSIQPGEWLSSGQYAVTFVSGLGCTWDTSFSIITSSPPTINQNTIDPTTVNVGTITVDVIGNFGPYDIHWIAENSSSWSIPFTTSGEHPFIITDSYNCDYNGLASVVVIEINELNPKTDWVFHANELNYRGQKREFPFYLFSTDGKLIKKCYVHDSTNFPLDLSPGLYYLSALNQTFRFVIAD